MPGIIQVFMSTGALYWLNSLAVTMEADLGGIFLWVFWYFLFLKPSELFRLPSLQRVVCANWNPFSR